MAAAFFLCSAAITGHSDTRTYIAERGDTWESAARKWGLYADELKARNSIFPELFTGLEIDLPESAAPEPLGTAAIARLESADRSLELGKEKLAARQYSSAASYLGTAVTLHGRATASVLFMQGQAREGLSDYEDAFEYYKKSLSRHSGGDNTLSEEQAAALEARIETTGRLAEQERLRREAEQARRREENERRLEARRKAEADARAKRQKRQSGGGWSWGWGNVASTPAWGGGWSQNIWNNVQSTWNTPTYGWNNTAIDWNSVTVDWNSVPMDMGTYTESFDNQPSGSGDPRDPITFSDHVCGLCDGKRTIVDSGATTFGQSGSKYCGECGRHVDLSHRHIQCPSCGGSGTVRKRDR